MMVVTGDGAEERVDSLLKRGCLSSSLEISMKSEWRAGQRAEKHAHRVARWSTGNHYYSLVNTLSITTAMAYHSLSTDIIHLIGWGSIGYGWTSMK